MKRYRAVLGQAKLATCFQIPPQASLQRDCENPSLILLRKWPCFSRLARDAQNRKNTGLRLVSKRGCVVKKHPQARLQVSFSQQLQHSHSESTPRFLFYYLTRSFPLISPCGPTSSCSTAHLPRCLVVYILVIRG